MSRVAVPEPGFQVPDTVGHVGRRDKDIGGRSSMGERFGSRLFAETLRNELGFTEPEITAAVDVLLEVAPLLVNKQVISVDDTTVRRDPPCSINPSIFFFWVVWRPAGPSPDLRTSASHPAHHVPDRPLHPRLLPTHNR